MKPLFIEGKNTAAFLLSYKMLVVHPEVVFVENILFKEVDLILYGFGTKVLYDGSQYFSYLFFYLLS